MVCPWLSVLGVSSFPELPLFLLCSERPLLSHQIWFLSIVIKTYLLPGMMEHLLSGSEAWSLDETSMGRFEVPLAGLFFHLQNTFDRLLPPILLRSY